LEIFQPLFFVSPWLKPRAIEREASNFILNLKWLTLKTYCIHWYCNYWK